MGWQNRPHRQNRVPLCGAGLWRALQFCRYALNIKALGAARVILEVQNPLVTLLRAMPGVDEIIGQGMAIPAHDVQCPLMSLPWLLQTRIDNMPAPIPYLRVDPALRTLWQNRLGPQTKPRVGIAWSGRATHNNDHNRSLSLARMLPLLSEPFEWISLQKEVRPADQPVLANAGIRTFAEHLHDFADTAALVEQLDLVVSVDTSVVHLAGALGKPVWVLLPEVPDWRWLMERPDTPWYPTMRLYRQGADKNYDPVLARIGADLATFTPQATPSVAAPASATIAEPTDANGWFRQGHALHQRGDIAGAAQRYQQALQLDPKHFDALHLLGVCQAQQNDNAAAEATLQRAVRINDQVASLWSNLGNVLSGLKRIDQALQSYQRAVQLDPQHLQAWFNMGCGLKDHKQHDAALHAFDQALRLQPDYVEARSARAQLLRDIKRFEDALTEYEHVIRLQPQQERHHSNRGLVLSDLGRTEEALVCFAQALHINPRYAGAHYNHALTLQRVNRLPEAIAGYDRAIDCDPKLLDAHWNRALTLLLAGRFTEGWPAYEVRWQKPEVQPLIRHDRSRAWVGQGGLNAIQGKTLLLHAEQGLGDTLMFCRYAPLLARLGVNIILEVQPELRTLVARTYPQLNVIAQGEAVPAHDFNTPLMSLPLVFNTTLDTIPSGNAYLVPDPQRVQHWQQALGEKTQPRIGIVYSGRPQHNADAKRSIPLAHLLTLLPADAELISLQRDVRESDRPTLAASGITHVGDQLTSFDETAAVCANLDAVIGVDTSVIHLAAALGLPTHVFIPRVPDWRWMLHRTDSPWYPTLRLHRQADDGTWPRVAHTFG